MDKYQKVFRFLEIILGLFFLLSGIGKMLNAARFGELISSYGLDWLSILSPLIIFVELMIGICLVLRVYVCFNLLISIIMLLSFTIAFGYANISNGVDNCGCFGNFEVRLPVWVTYSRNVALLLLALFLWKYRVKPHKGSDYGKLKIIMLITFMAVSVFWTGHTWQLPSFYMNRFAKPHRLIGIEANNTVLNQYINISNDSTYVVWVFSYSCNGCINGVENIKQYQEGVADKFVALAVTADKGGRIRKLLGIPFKPIEVGDGLAGFIKVVPTLLYIERGKIKYVIEQTVPNVYTFKSVYLEMSNNDILNKMNSYEETSN